MQGCVYRAKQSQLVTHIPQAAAHGARIYADVEAVELVRDNNAVQALKAQVINRASNRPSGVTLRFEAKAFVLAAGGYYSAPFLLRQGLQKQLPQLGKHFGMNPSAMVMGQYAEDIVMWRNIPAAFGVEHFRLPRHDEQGRYLEGGYLLMANQVQPGLLGSMLPLRGEELGTWMGNMRRIGGTIAWIDDPAHELGELTLAKDDTPKVNYPYGPQTRAMLRDTIRKQAEIQFAIGARQLVVAGSQGLQLKSTDDLRKIDNMPIVAGGLFMAAPHPSGGCIMGRSAQDSVTDSSHRVHGFDNLFVADSSVFPTPVSVDPSFTIMAFSYIAAQHIHAALS